MSKTHANGFLDHLDKDKSCREAVRAAAKSITEVGAKHGFKFTVPELENALKSKWGTPSKRPESGDDPYTCISETPGY